MDTVNITLKENQAQFILRILMENVSVTGKEAALELVEMVGAFEAVVELPPVEIEEEKTDESTDE